MARPGRPATGRPYICGPYKHRARWRLVVYTGRRPGADRGRASYRRSFETEEAAKRWRRQFEREVATGGRTVREAMIAYREHLVRNKNKASSIATSGYRLDAILNTEMALTDLTPKKAAELYGDLVDTKAAVSTHRGCLIAAKAFGRFCLEQSWISVNPFAKVKPIGLSKRGKKQMRTDDSRVYLRHCLAQWAEHKDRSAIAAVLPLVLSLRAGEVAQLLAGDVDDRGRILRIGETEAKTDSSQRAARVPGPFIPILRDLAATPATPAGHLFAKSTGEPADRHWVSWHARRLMKAAGVKVVTTHGLRGTWATEAITGGQALEAVAREMGHADKGGTATAHYIDRQAAADVRSDQVVSALLDAGEPNEDF